MATLIVDIETDGLLDTMTKVHCVVMKLYQKNRYGIYVSPENLRRAEIWAAAKSDLRSEQTVYNSLSNLCLIGHRVVAHNILGFDSLVLRDHLEVELDPLKQCIDTLVMSRYLNPDQGGHSLAWWAKYLNIDTKVQIDNWEEQPLEDYLDRCVRDVQINEQVYSHLRAAFKEPRIRAGFTLAQSTYWDMCKQERTGVCFDEPYATSLRKKITDEMEEISADVEPRLGMAPLPKSKQPTFPERPFRKDGTLSITALRYGKRIGVVNPGTLIVEIEKGPKKLMAQVTLDNMVMVKEYLFNEGWVPTIWRTNDITKNGKLSETIERRNTRAEKYVKDTWNSPYREMVWDQLDIPNDLRIPYDDLNEITMSRALYRVVRKGRELPMSPMMTFPVSKALCPNLEKMSGPIVKRILRWMSLKNRAGVIKGWLENSRLERDGRLTAGSSGICNTHRQRHHTVVNVPKAKKNVVYGIEMRSLFVAPEGWVCVGCDAAGLEARVTGHYTYPHDGGEYARILLEGDTHAVNAAAYSEAIDREVTRDDSKPVTYGTLYGASGKKVAAMLDVSVNLGTLVVKAFWDANPGLKAYKEFLIDQWKKNNKKFVLGIDGRYIHTRSKHSLVNAVFQSAGAIIMDKAWELAQYQMNILNVQRWGYFHDEYQVYARPEVANMTGQAIATGIVQAGVHFKMNLPLAGDYKIGRNWSETH